MHEGHRERLRERYAEGGAGVFSEHELLELLLTYAIPRRDTNEIAHALIGRFGSLQAVLNAEIPELVRVDGVGESAAVFLHLVGDAALLHAQRMHKKRTAPRIASAAEAGAYALELLAHEKYECVYAVSLDKNMRLIHAEQLLSGTLTEAPLYPRRVVESALLHGAYAVLLLHNHPSGDPTPSEADAQATEAVRAALAGVDIRLFDHLVAGRGSVYSFLREGFLSFGPDGAEISGAEAPPLAAERG